jgi:hypothetical protein
VTWTEKGAGKAALEVFVNSSNGRVFGYRNLTTGLTLGVPVISREVAVRLVGQSSYASGETPDPSAASSDPLTELYSYFDSQDGHEWAWDVFLPDRLLRVDAETGDVWAVVQ